MAELKQTERATLVLSRAMECCKSCHHEFITPEHLLSALVIEYNFNSALRIFYSPEQLLASVQKQLARMETVPEGLDYAPDPSEQMGKVIEIACQQVYYSSAKAVDIPHLVMGLLHLQESWACYLLKDALQDKESEFVSQLLTFCDMEDRMEQSLSNVNYDDEEEETLSMKSGEEAWRRLVTCMNHLYQDHNPLIGREQELQRTIQVLCRLDKNNPLHVGEPGVGKTALIWGLARMIEEGRVPERLQGSRIYQLDMGTLLAGTQYRGDFEQRIKQIMDGIKEESDRNIVYIDEIHTLVGSGATNDSSMDGANMLKPYLESGSIRFIGSTTYEEYNKYFSRSKGMVRRFQQIDIAEPSIEETVNILQQLRPRYEEYHHVVYDDDALRFAAEASAKYVNDRFLPDKAIDIIDEAGAAMECSMTDGLPSPVTSDRVTKEHIADVLAKTCKVDAMAMNDDDTERLADLSEQLSASIYGQDEAIRQVTEAVLTARAGLLDDNKPQASLLFVGPTGVGKTEVARVLARQLGIELVRFDMSEYTEKHTVAKLIGSPAGYVGYEDGGLLTDAIRKTPNCVLLLDEIEKAHQDIYNILLQVMDYARLTDNKGRKADFRNVILIMTSNAGAQYASQASIGFQGRVSRGEAMLKQVKKTFKPEFINRLSATVTFRDMDRQMATLILRKKLRELQEKLSAKKVELTVGDDAFERLLNEGFTAEYGAREMDRVISQRLKPLLTRAILFGRLKNGGKATVALRGNELSLD